MFKSIINFFLPKYFITNLSNPHSQQCCERSSSSAEFNVCIRPKGHFGAHVSADGESWL